MSRLRPTLRSNSDKPCVSNGTAYLMIHNAVKTRRGLVHGHLELEREYCAIGSFFHVNTATALPTDLVDEVAAVNDSMPASTPRQRRTVVLRWLRWKLAMAGLPGFVKAVKP